MQLIVISKEKPYAGEAEQMNQVLRVDENIIVHLRHPECDADTYRKVLDKIAPELIGRITLGDHFELVDEYEVGGVHLSQRNPRYDGERTVRMSKSCHKMSELKDRKFYNYVFLSPIFDSISKKGYNSAFGDKALEEATTQGIIDKKVYALGGVCENNIEKLKQYGFGGAAVLGCIWKENPAEEAKKLIGKLV